VSGRKGARRPPDPSTPFPEKGKGTAGYEAVVASGVARCSGCRAVKPLAEFPKGRKKRDGQKRYGYCNPCHRLYSKRNRFARVYNITLEEYDRILAHQGGVCYICLHPPKKIKLAVDHNHKTGQIRGLLCMLCNRAVGFFRDDDERIARVFNYVTSPPASEALGGHRYGIKGRVDNKAKTKRRLNRNRIRPTPVGLFE